MDYQLASPIEIDDAVGSLPLSNYSSDELLAASDSIFELLDDPAGHSGTELHALYDAVCRELDLREVSGMGLKHAVGN